VVDSPHLVPSDGIFRAAGVPTRPPKWQPSKHVLEQRLQASVDELDALQRRLHADELRAVLLSSSPTPPGTAKCATASQ
jgi:hypothetical protein